MVRALAVYERLEDRLTGSAERLGADLFAPRPPVECRVAEAAGGLVGYALFHTIYSSFRARPAMWLEDIYVEPAHRGRGLGRALLAEVAREAAARGCVRLSWAVLEWNEPSIRFYKWIGAVRAEGGWHTYQLDESRFGTLGEIRAPGPENAGG
jgi:GNAT superfamily N-acetyltransferase